MGMNANRAEWAGAAIETFRADTGTDQEDAVADLLADLMHFCDLVEGQPSFDAALERGRMHYDAEISGEE